jgi:hypothetical protein
MLIIATTGHPQLGRRAEIPPLAIRHRYLAYPRQRFQGSPRFRRTPSLHDREVRRRVATPQVAYVLQPSGSAALQDQRSAHTEAHVGCRGDGRLRTGVRGIQNYCAWQKKPVAIGIFSKTTLSASRPARCALCVRRYAALNARTTIVKTNRMEKTTEHCISLSLKNLVVAYSLGILSFILTSMSLGRDFLR